MSEETSDETVVISVFPITITTVTSSSILTTLTTLSTTTQTRHDYNHWNPSPSSPTPTYPIETTTSSINVVSFTTFSNNGSISTITSLQPITLLIEEIPVPEPTVVDGVFTTLFSTTFSVLPQSESLSSSSSLHATATAIPSTVTPSYNFNQSEGNGTLGSGAIAGIVTGVFIVVGLAIFAFGRILWRQHFERVDGRGRKAVSEMAGDGNRWQLETKDNECC